MTDDHRDANDEIRRCNAVPTSGQQQRLDEILSALADTRRRYVLHYLQTERQASLTDAARQVAAWQHECSPTDIRDELLEDLETRLYHADLPMLEDLRLIEYDDRSGQLLFREPPALVEMCLDHCADRELPD